MKIDEFKSFPLSIYDRIECVYFCYNDEDLIYIGQTIDFRHLVSDPLDEYDMVCKRCAEGRRREAEEMQAYEYEHKMPEYQKHIR